MQNTPFSLLMPVYFKDTPKDLRNALNSILAQTLLPAEIVIVADGPLTDGLNDTLQHFQQMFTSRFIIHRLPENRGLGIALAEGLNICTYDLVARMDSDDIAVPERFAIQIDYINRHPQAAVVGGFLEEFQSVPGDIGTVRKLPLLPDDVRKFARFRNPLNHPTVVMNKSYILQCGSYEHMTDFEDYYLWIKVLQRGYEIHNVNHIVLHYNIGNNMVSRRRGLKYLKSEMKFIRAAMDTGFFNTLLLLYFYLIRVPLRLAPEKLLRWIYKMSRTK